MAGFKFRHILRPEETRVYDPLAYKTFSAPGTFGTLKFTQFPDEYSLYLDAKNLQVFPDSTWRVAVYERALQTGYRGSMGDFFCRDAKEESSYTRVDGDKITSTVCFTWRGRDSSVGSGRGSYLSNDMYS